MSKTEEKKDKGKGKQKLELLESDTEDEDFDVSDQELYDSEEESDLDSQVSDQNEEQVHDEITQLFEEAEENGDGGDMVIGLRPGKRKQDVIIPKKESGASSSKKVKQ